MVRLLVPPIAFGLLLSAGCALSLDGPVAGRAARTRPTCDTSKGFVALDGVVGAGLAISALGSVANDEPGAGAVFGLLAVAFLGSAIHGNTVVQTCRTEITAFDAELLQAREVEVAHDRAVPAQPAAVARPTPPAAVARPTPSAAVARPTPPAAVARPTPPAPADPSIAAPPSVAANQAAPSTVSDDEWAAFWMVMP